jgi:hypothetical protein
MGAIEEIADRVVYTPTKCWDCPFFADEVPWCPLYQRRFYDGDKTRPDFCRVSRINIEFGG